MKIAVVSDSKRFAAADLDLAVAACATQLTQHFCPAWELVPPTVQVFKDLASVPADFMAVLVTDDPDQPGALGYHSELQGREFGRIFVSPVLDNGGVALLDPQNVDTPSVASVLSHELMELVADPFVDYWADGPAIGQGSCYALEVADPVQGFAYQVQVPRLVSNGDPDGGGQVVTAAPGDTVGVAVSDFVLPAWFDDQGLGKQVDFLAKCEGPFQIAQGGYMVVRGAPGSEQQVMFARTDLRPPEWRVKKHPTARGARRVPKKP